MNAFKRITVEFTHEVDGQPKIARMDFVRRTNTGISMSRDAFESNVVETLQQVGMIKPRIIGIDHHTLEPPLFEL
jgi:hypothetical protein